MAEYIWIDGSNGVRCKSKVRAFHFTSTMLHCHESFCGYSVPTPGQSPHEEKGCISLRGSLVITRLASRWLPISGQAYEAI